MGSRNIRRERVAAQKSGISKDPALNARADFVQSPVNRGPQPLHEIDHGPRPPLRQNSAEARASTRAMTRDRYFPVRRHFRRGHESHPWATMMTKTAMLDAERSALQTWATKRSVHWHETSVPA